MQRKGTGMASDVPISTKKSLKRLINYLSYSKHLLILAITLAILSTIFSLVGPQITGQMINDIENGTMTNLVNLSILLVIFYLLSMILGYLLTVIMIQVSQRTTRIMRQDLFNKILDLPISFYDKRTVGDIVSRITYDIDLVNTSLSTDVVQMFKSVIILIFSFSMMVSISWILTLVILLILPFNIYFAKYRLKKVKPLFKKRSQGYGALNGYSEEMLSSLKIISIYNMDESVIEKFDFYNDQATENAYIADKEPCKLGPSVNFISNITLVINIIAGSILYLTQMITLGGISSFIQYSKKFQAPINEFSNLISEIQSSLAALERVINIIDMNDELYNKRELYEIDICKGNIEFKNVVFGYTEDILFNDLNLKIKENQKIAIVGPTGSGKTTIINLLMRFYEINSGIIYLDEYDSYDIKLNSFRKNYSYVSQEGWIFTGTIFENIAYANENATLEDVIEAAKKAQIHEYIDSLPNKYDTIISSKSNLSKGQAQLISIARAILSDAKIIILDEATSNVDTKTEADIQEAIKKACINKTSFIIAHRLQTIVSSDLIIVVQDGKIVESGTHFELLNQNGSYSSLFNSQFK